MEELLVLMAGLGVFVMLFSFGISILIFIATWKLFEKAGEEGWKILIPVYNAYIIAKIGTGNGWLIFAPFVGGILSAIIGKGFIVGIVMLVVYAIMIYVQFSFIRRFTDTGLAILAMFVPFIVYPIVAFSDKYTYDNLY